MTIAKEEILDTLHGGMSVISVDHDVVFTSYTVQVGPFVV
jgi:hypothetical protein